MTHTPHELAADFPEHAEKIHQLKNSDAHFAKLAARYHEINRSVHRAETQIEVISQPEEERLRKERALLKDQIYAMLRH